MKSLPAGFFALNLFRAANNLQDFSAESVHAIEVSAHTLQHDLAIDVDHVGVPHPAPVHDVGHLHARLQFVALRVHGEDADFAGLHVVGDLLRQISQRARRQVFQHKRPERRTEARQSCAMLAAISRQSLSVMMVTFSDG